MSIFIRRTVFDIWGKSAALRIPILYGGSVSSDNAASFVRENCIDGVLVGTDSLEPTLFAGIITSLS